MPETTNKKYKLIHRFMSPEKYHNLQEKDPHTLYFLTNGELYKGTVLYGGQIQIIDNNSIPMQGVNNRIYANIDTLELLTWRNGRFQSLIPKVTGNIETNGSTDNDEDIVTKGAVKDYINKLVANGSLAGGYDGPLANVPSKVIRTNEDIHIIDQTIGKYRPGDVIKAGTSINEIFKNIFTKVIDVTYNKPSVRLSPVKISVEAGTISKFVFKILYDKADGGEVESILFLKGINNIYGDPIFHSKHVVKEYTTPEPITVTDSDLLQYKVVVRYSAGSIKSNNIGEEIAEGVIEAGSAEDVCTLIGERFTWYQSSPLGNVQYNKSSVVRGLTDRILGAKKGSQFSIDVTRGDREVVIAYPKIIGPIESVKSRTMSMELKDSFTPAIVMVEGANGYRSIEYYVYTYTPNTPFASNDTFEVIL